jgi:hypothetical protein
MLFKFAWIGLNAHLVVEPAVVAAPTATVFAVSVSLNNLHNCSINVETLKSLLNE